MNFQAHINSKNEVVYRVEAFTAKELPSIVKMVRFNEENFKANFEKSIEATKEAEKELPNTTQ